MVKNEKIKYILIGAGLTLAYIYREELFNIVKGDTVVKIVSKKEEK